MIAMFLLVTLLLVISPVFSVTAPKQPQNVTILGLGHMGNAIVKCYAQHGHTVHAWNRSDKNRQAVHDLHIPNVTVYENLGTAIQESDIIIMAIDGGFSKVEGLLQSVPRETWNQKTLVQFSSHTPNEAKKQDEIMLSLDGAGFVGGALVAVPATLCSDSTIILVSSANDDVWDKLDTTLDKLGRVVRFPQDDAGLASLANMGIIQSLTFGIAGHEMAHLLMNRYNAPPSFISQYSQLVTEIVPLYVPMLFGVISQSVTSEKWEDSYVPNKDFLQLLEMHAEFASSMGVKGDTFLDSYIRYLKLVTNDAYGPSAWIEHAFVDPSDSGEKDL